MNNKLRGAMFCIVFLVSVFLAHALDECQGVMTKQDVPCLVLLPLNTSHTNCSDVNISYYNNASTLLFQEPMYEYNTFTCNSTFNQTANGIYTIDYTTGDSGSITITSEDDTMGSLSITLFIMAVNLGLFVLPFFIRLKSPIADNIVKKSIWLLALGFLSINTTVIASIAEYSGIEISGVLWNIYYWLFTKAIWVGFIAMIFYIATSTRKIWSHERERKEAGTDDNA